MRDTSMYQRRCVDKATCQKRARSVGVIVGCPEPGMCLPGSGGEGLKANDTPGGSPCVGSRTRHVLGVLAGANANVDDPGRAPQRPGQRVGEAPGQDDRRPTLRDS